MTRERRGEQRKVSGGEGEGKRLTKRWKAYIIYNTYEKSKGKIRGETKGGVAKRSQRGGLENRLG